MSFDALLVDQTASSQQQHLFMDLFPNGTPDPHGTMRQLLALEKEALSVPTQLQLRAAREVSNVIVTNMGGGGGPGIIRCLLRIKTLATNDFGRVEVVQQAWYDPSNHTAQLIPEEKLLVAKSVRFDRVVGLVNPLREAAIHELCTRCSTGQRVLPLLGAFCSDKAMYSIVPYAPCGDLMQQVSVRPMPSALGFTREQFRDMVLGVNDLHELRICHHDISLENFLVTEDNRVALMDFGLSRAMGPDFQLQNTAQIGKVYSMAPEVFFGHDQRVDGRKVDTWGLGVMLFVLLTNSLPFDVPSEKLDAQYKQRVVNQRWEQCIPSFGNNVMEAEGLLKDAECWLVVDLLKNLFHENPVARYSCDDILKHPWMSGSMIRSVY